MKTVPHTRISYRTWKRTFMIIKKQQNHFLNTRVIEKLQDCEIYFCWVIAAFWWGRDRTPKSFWVVYRCNGYWYRHRNRDLSLWGYLPTCVEPVVWGGGVTSSISRSPGIPRMGLPALSWRVSIWAWHRRWGVISVILLRNIPCVRELVVVMIHTLHFLFELRKGWHNSCLYVKLQEPFLARELTTT